MATNKISISEIAKKSGVSAATVSRVINHRHLVKENTIKKVELAMMDMGYQFSRSIETIQQEQRIIVLNMPENENIFYQEVLKGAQASAKAHGFYLLAYESYINPGTIHEFCALLHRVQASGVILLNQIPLDLLHQIHAIVPLVQCCEYNKEAPYSYVTVDDRAAAINATEHLLSCGHNKIAFLNGPLSYKYAIERREGFLSAMNAADVTVPKAWIVQLPEVNYEMAYSAACRLLNAETIPSAFFVISDLFAFAVIRAAKRYRLRVPNDIMIVGFDNIVFSNMISPSITTVNQPRFQLGYSACEILVEQIDFPTSDPKSLVLDTELLVRETTSLRVDRPDHSKLVR